MLALRTAERHLNHGDTMVILHVPVELCFDPSQAGPELTQQVMEVRERKVREVMDSAKAAVGDGVHLECVVGDAGNGARQEFVDLATRDKQIDTLVLGAEGLNSHSHMWAGSLVDYLVHTAPCSVVVVRERA
eukprot:TRINITY_DN25601_c0_g1_i1.p2 TRINITY_DN25601_c0_g1~~TRINITY_DN25601_c0_g1_i1.p2  ORF type:complete len:132 (-),score=38.21 TRINITY_DN25601_c0_g1_i1:153-548(-)